MYSLAAGGDMKGIWELPTSRHWASGLCVLPDDQGLIAGAIGET